MDRRKPQIKKDRVDMNKSVSIGVHSDIGIAVVHQHHSITESRKALSREFEIRGITIDA